MKTRIRSVHRPTNPPPSSAPTRFAAPEGSQNSVDLVIQHLASTEITAFLNGGSSATRARIARRIHEVSNRLDRAACYVDCSLIATQDDLDFALIEAGAGTIFLDRVETLTAALQARLLRVLESGWVDADTPFLARLLAGSGRDLTVAVRGGGFCKGLFHRLAHFPVQLPLSACIA